MPAAAVGALAHLDEVALCSAALGALGLQSTPRRVARFLLARWYALSSDAALARQAARLSADWAARNVQLMGAPPPNSILVSVHHTCQFLAFVRLSRLLPDLGFVSTVSWENRPETVRAGLLLDLMDRSFGSRVYRPGQAARAGLALLRSGGSLLLFSDFAASGVPTPLLGRRVPLARGPEWFAQQTGCPIIPVMVVPNRRGWALWCGEPVATTQDGIDACIRQAPASWLGWRDWFDASVVA